ncbi:hypothetical protein GCM10009827_075600 [Dactylosporangium maewongense]|uniref:Integral membrane protein n=1 Tax=Dactylosporangium maewongense TaxID=634393 RepID=A0ABP4MMF3_9ACTN
MKEQLTEPWGLVAAGVLGGVGGAVGAALAPAGVLAGIPVGLAVAGVVYGVRIGVGALFGRGPGRRSARHLPVPARGGDAERWLRRAESAVQTLHRQAETPSDAVLRVQVAGVDERAAEALGDLVRFAGQVTLVERTSAGIDVARLEHDRAQLTQGIDGLPAGPLRAERERALRAVTDQLGVARRLHDAREMLLARMQSAVLGLEGLVARMAELLALHAASDVGTSLTAVKVAELAAGLEGMRDGLAEAERLSRSALTGEQVQ